MMRIDSLVARPDRTGRHTVKLSDGSSLRLYPQTVQDFSLYPGMELTQDELSRLRTAAGQMSAKMRAVRIVAASNVSKADLQQRLVRKGETPDQARQAVAWMEELSLVDDEETAQQLVQRCISKGYGKARAKQLLYEKMIPKQYWDAALEDYPDQTESILSFLRTKLSTGFDQKDQKRAVDALLRRGHSYSQIRQALRLLDIQADPFQEEI